jgi:hypothetical protein
MTPSGLCSSRSDCAVTVYVWAAKVFQSHCAPEGDTAQPSQLPVAKLKEALKERGMPTKGSKPELVARYEAALRAASAGAGAARQHGMAWHGMAWHGTAWHGMASHCMALRRGKGHLCRRGRACQGT